ncbi:MAG: excisionase family DNA-binding protein [Betaproteobacteria bacterium]|jgi:excisionase family DNA binding protein|nr:excisionase family DNA-binding protein [Betaproteobacteria bacterium]
MAKRASTERRKAPYCTTREAAGLLGVSVRTVQLWAESGVLEVWKTEGGHRRIGVDSLNRFMAGEVPAPQRGRASEPFKIVVADDDTALLRLYRIRVQGWDPRTEVYAARDGVEALLLVGREQPNMLITEAVLPGLDAMAMIRALANHPQYSGLEIIVVTALTPAALAGRGGLPAEIRVHTKPVPFGELEREVRSAAHGWQTLVAAT